MAVHGTGTPLGDPIEVGAVGQGLAAASASSAQGRAVSMVSNKACFGHTEGAAGISGNLNILPTLTVFITDVGKLEA